MLAQLENDARNTARMASFSVAPALVFGDRTAAADALRGVESLNDLSYVVVEDASGARFAAIRPERMTDAERRRGRSDPSISTTPFIRPSEPVTHGGARVGTIHVAISLDSMRAEIARMRRTIGWVSLFVFLAGLAATLGISTYVTRPLVKMVETAEEIAAGEWDRRAPITSRDEAGQLALSFNAMLDRLDEARLEREELEPRARSNASRSGPRSSSRRSRNGGAARRRCRNRTRGSRSPPPRWTARSTTGRSLRTGSYWTEGLTRVFGYPLDDASRRQRLVERPRPPGRRGSRPTPARDGRRRRTGLRGRVPVSLFRRKIPLRPRPRPGALRRIGPSRSHGRIRRERDAAEERSRSSSARVRRWRRSAGSPAASRTTSTTC